MTELATPAVELSEGRPFVSSTKVAEHFDKPHNRVLEAIRGILKELPADSRESNFRHSEYERKTPLGHIRTYPAYLLSRDGFTLLAMGFTGKKALQWKIRYIEAFNAMEAELAKRSLPALSTKEDRRPLKDLVAVYVGLAPLSFRDAWKLIHAKFGVTTVDDLTVDQVREACAFLQQRIDAVVAKANQKPKALPAPSATLSGADLLEFSKELDLYKTEEDSFLTLQRHHFEDMRYKIRTAEYGSKKNKPAMNLHLQGYYRLMGLCCNLMGVAAEVYSETAKQTEQALKIAGKI